MKNLSSDHSLKRFNFLHPTGLNLVWVWVSWLLSLLSLPLPLEKENEVSMSGRSIIPCPQQSRGFIFTAALPLSALWLGMSLFAGDELMGNEMEKLPVNYFLTVWETVKIWYPSQTDISIIFNSSLGKLLLSTGFTVPLTGGGFFRF